MQRVLSTLVVDDDESVRDAVSALLESIGYEVETVADISQAIAFLRIRAPDVVICDYMLGNQTPHDLVSRHEFERVLVRVLLTGHEPESIDSNITQRFTSVVEKKLGSGALVAAIQRG